MALARVTVKYLDQIKHGPKLEGLIKIHYIKGQEKCILRGKTEATKSTAV